MNCEENQTKTCIGCKDKFEAIQQSKEQQLCPECREEFVFCSTCGSLIPRWSAIGEAMVEDESLIGSYLPAKEDFPRCLVCYEKERQQIREKMVKARSGAHFRMTLPPGHAELPPMQRNFIAATLSQLFYKYDVNEILDEIEEFQTPTCFRLNSGAREYTEMATLWGIPVELVYVVDDRDDFLEMAKTEQQMYLQDVMTKKDHAIIWSSL